MLSHLLIYLFGYVLIADLCSGWLLVNVWHNVQYIVFVWQYNRRRFASGIDPQAKALSWLVQPGWRRAGLYFAASIVLAMPFYYLLPQLGQGLAHARDRAARLREELPRALGQRLVAAAGHVGEVEGGGADPV